METDVGGIRTRKAAARAGPANWTPAESFNRLAGSMKRKSGDRTVTVEEFHRKCLRAAKLPLGEAASGRGARLRRRGRRVAEERKGRTLWDRPRVR